MKEKIKLLLPISFLLMIVDAWEMLTNSVHSLCYSFDNVIAGEMEVLDFVRRLFWFGETGYYVLFRALTIAAFAIMLYCVLKKKTNMLLIVGPAILTVTQFVHFLVMISKKNFSLSTYNRVLETVLSPVFASPYFFTFLAALILLLIVGVFLLKNESKIKTIAKKVWFLPAVMLLLGEILTWIISILCKIFKWGWGLSKLGGDYGFFYETYYVVEDIIYIVIFMAALTTFALYVWKPFEKKVEEIPAENVEE